MTNPVASFFGELKRRKVLSASATYLIVGWVIIEVASVLVPTLLLPEWTLRLITILILLGFPITIVLSWVFDITSQGLQRTNAPDRIETIVDRPVLATRPPSPDEAIISVAVMPFDALGSDEQHHIFAQGLTTEIHGMLAKHNRIRVLSRRVVAKFQDDVSTDLVDKFGIRYLLSGNVVFSEDRVRIIAELEDARRNEQIWSERFERGLDDRLSVLSDIAEAVVKAFGVEHLRSELNEARHNKAENLDAWQLVQKARAHLLDSEEDAFQQAQKWLQKAIELEPEYAAAHATLAFSIGEQLLNGAAENVEQSIEQARLSTQRALASAPQDQFVLKMAGMAWSAIGEPTRSCEVLNRSVDLAPFDFGAWGYLGWPLTARGREDDLVNLLEILDRILAASPDHPGASFWLHHRAVALCCSGDLGGAERAARAAVDGSPNLSWAWMNFANIRALQDDIKGAQDAVDNARRANSLMSIEHYKSQLERMSENEGFYARRTDGLVRLK